jgi:hypothetical protein
MIYSQFDALKFFQASPYILIYRNIILACVARRVPVRRAIPSTNSETAPTTILARFQTVDTLCAKFKKDATSTL